MGKNCRQNAYAAPHDQDWKERKDFYLHVLPKPLVYVRKTDANSGLCWHLAY